MSITFSVNPRYKEVRHVKQVLASDTRSFQSAEGVIKTTSQDNTRMQWTNEEAVRVDMCSAFYVGCQRDTARIFC